MDIQEVLKKIEKTETPKVNKVAVAYSGGLDSSLAIELLRRKYKAEKILPVTIDVGQGEEEILEGSSGKGNDQYLMHNVFKMIAPEL